MTWEDDLYRVEERLNALKERQRGLIMVADLFKEIDEALKEIERTRSTIGEKTYSTQKAELLRLQEYCHSKKREYIDAVGQIAETRRNLQRAWLKNEELRNKGIRG